jgi:hypothetical protein
MPQLKQTEAEERRAADPYADLAVREDPLSRDARHSTYKQLDPPEGVTPPPGPMVEQTLGKPQEARD